MNECGLLSTINTSVCQHLLTIYCVHITTGKIFKALLTLKNDYVKITFKSEPCNNVYLSYFCFTGFIKFLILPMLKRFTDRLYILRLPMAALNCL